MKKIVVILLATALSLGMSAQPKDVVLVVTGDGTSKEIATNNALRSAVEQAFGVFVSANTEILNDELVRDEIATITSGNIKSFKELSAEKAPSGDWFVSLQAEVSIGNLVSYAKSHGSSAEFAGNTFAANLRIRELNKQNEAVALDNLVAHVKRMSHQMYDFKLYSDENPMYFAELDAYVFSMGVEICPNETSVGVLRTIRDVLDALKMTPQEVEEYKKNNNPYSLFTIWYSKYSKISYGSGFINTINVSGIFTYPSLYALRNDNQKLSMFCIELSEAMTDAIFDFRVQTNNPLRYFQLQSDDFVAAYNDFVVTTYKNSSEAYRMRSPEYIFFPEYLGKYIKSPFKGEKEDFFYKGFCGQLFYNEDGVAYGFPANSYPPKTFNIFRGQGERPFKYMVNRYFTLYYPGSEYDLRLKRELKLMDLYIPGVFLDKNVSKKVKNQVSQSIFCVVPVIIKKEDLPKLTGFEVRRPEEFE